MIDTTLEQRKAHRDKLLYDLMKDGRWYTLDEINKATGYPSASASAGIRSFRHKTKGSNTVEKNYLGKGVYQYRLVLNSNDILKNYYQ
jgi:hypothetical protein